MAKKYNKAIRDRIPEIIEQKGSKCKIKKMSDAEYLPHIEKKLTEEVDEYYSDGKVEELADIMEVVYKIAELKGYTAEQLEGIRIEKNKKRGGFKQNLFLIETT